MSPVNQAMAACAPPRYISVLRVVKVSFDQSGQRRYIVLSSRILIYGGLMIAEKCQVASRMYSHYTYVAVSMAYGVFWYCERPAFIQNYLSLLLHV